MNLTGLVVKYTGNKYTVRDDSSGKIYICFIRGKMRLEDTKSTNPVVIGDKVVFEPTEGLEGIISEVLPRFNCVVRKSSNLSRQFHILAANINKAFLVVTIDFPRTSFEFIDRFLVTCEAYKVNVSIVVNKVDLYVSEELKLELTYFKDIYLRAGYEIMEVSATTGENVELIRKQIPNNTILFAGNSGVGKSTLINCIAPDLSLRTGEISHAHGKGKHTTTFSEMFEVHGGYIIDTPGIKGFGLVDLDKHELHHFFPEIFALSPACKYGMCTHTHEPDCAVKDAVEKDIVSACRYMSYLKMLEDEGSKYR